MSPRKWCRLDSVADVGLGYKSLQNDFYYLNSEQISSFGIEPEYYTPIFVMSDIDLGAIIQHATPKRNLFYCDLPEKDLGGSGALRYCRAMENMPAKRKKQTGKPLSIRATLEKQGGGLWYAPKARLHQAHIWCRKAISGVFSPFLFPAAVGFDQRCNYLIPKTGSWGSLAAMASSTLFALSLESEGAAAMGAGALEVPTKILRRIRVPDLRLLNGRQLAEAEGLARKAWKSAPIDWGGIDPRPDEALKALDRFWIQALGKGLDVEQVYRQLEETCKARLGMAKGRSETKKKTAKKSIERVARAVADSVRQVLGGRMFPESFLTGSKEVFEFEVGDGNLYLRLSPVLSQCHLLVEHEDGRAALDHEYDSGVGEVIVRALLLGRRKFSVPKHPHAAREILRSFHAWFPSIRNQIEEAWRHSAWGTRYEEDFRKLVFKMLGVHPEVDRPLANHYTISNDSVS